METAYAQYDLGWYKSFTTKSAIADVDFDMFEWVKKEHERLIAEILNCEEADCHHRWYDLDNPTERVEGLTDYEFMADLHRGEWLLQSYGKRK